MIARETASDTRAQQVLARLLGESWRQARIERIGTSTNFVARASRGAEAVALRIASPTPETLAVDRTVECHALQAAAAAGLAPALLASDVREGILVTRWVEGTVWSLERAREPDAIARAGRLFEALHALELPKGVPTLDLDGLIGHYLALLDGARDPYAAACRELEPEARRRLAGLPRTRAVLCHCDAHHANWIENERLYLVDWEYAGACDRLFDLAAYSRYHGLDDAAARRLLAASGAGESLETLRRWEWLFDYLCLLWLRAATPPGGRPRGNAQVVARLDPDTLVARLRGSRP